MTELQAPLDRDLGPAATRGLPQTGLKQCDIIYIIIITLFHDFVPLNHWTPVSQNHWTYTFPHFPPSNSDKAREPKTPQEANYTRALAPAKN